MAGRDVLEFRVTRVPEVRAFFRDFHNSSVQWLGESRELRMVGEASVLWRGWRTAAAIVEDTAAGHVMDLLLSQGLNIASLEGREQRRAAEIIRLRQELVVEQAIREHLESDLRSRDGAERTAERVLDVMRRARAAGFPGRGDA